MFIPAALKTWPLHKAKCIQETVISAFKAHQGSIAISTALVLYAYLFPLDKWSKYATMSVLIRQMCTVKNFSEQTGKKIKVYIQRYKLQIDS